MDNLFNNPMVQQARKALTKEQLDRYAMLGESMYKDIDFENCTVNNLPPFMADSVNRIKALIKSGLHISMLSNEEKALMMELVGCEWYLPYGFTKDDLTEIVNMPDF